MNSNTAHRREGMVVSTALRIGLFLVIMHLVCAPDVYAQREKGDVPLRAVHVPVMVVRADSAKDRGGMNPDDSIYVFESPVPLVGAKRNDIVDPTSLFFRLMISGNGYGLGFGYAYDHNANWSMAAELALTGARNTSELEMQDPYTLIIYVPNKINRIFLVPMLLTGRYTIPREYVAENIAPYVSVGAGASAVVQAPYDPLGDVFSSLGSSTSYVRPAAYAGAGITMENTETSYVTLDARYYVLPFGGAGIESIRGKPMKDFNGVFLSLAIGFR